MSKEVIRNFGLGRAMQPKELNEILVTVGVIRSMAQLLEGSVSSKIRAVLSE